MMGLTYGDFEDALKSFIARRVDADGDNLMHRLSAGWDGDKFCVLVGPDLQEGEGFFGDTSDEAVKAFLASLLAQEDA